MESDETDNKRYTLEVLPRYVGNRYALLLSYIGYKTLDDLAKVPEFYISSLGGFGPARMRKLEQALADHGLCFLHVPKRDLMGKIHETLGSLGSWQQPRTPPHQRFQEAWSQVSSPAATPSDRAETTHRVAASRTARPSP